MDGTSRSGRGVSMLRSEQEEVDLGAMNHSRGLELVCVAVAFPAPGIEGDQVMHLKELLKTILIFLLNLPRGNQGAIAY